VMTFKTRQPDRGAEQVDKADKPADLPEHRIALRGGKIKKNIITRGRRRRIRHPPKNRTPPREGLAPPNRASRPSRESKITATSMNHTAWV